MGGHSPTVHDRRGQECAASVRKIRQPRLTELRTRNAHERLNGKRASAEEGKRSDDHDGRH